MDGEGLHKPILQHVISTKGHVPITAHCRWTLVSNTNISRAGHNHVTITSCGTLPLQCTIGIHPPCSLKPTPRNLIDSKGPKSRSYPNQQLQSWLMYSEGEVSPNAKLTTVKEITVKTNGRCMHFKEKVSLFRITVDTKCHNSRSQWKHFTQVWSQIT